MNLFKIIELELEESGQAISESRLVHLKSIISTSSSIEKFNIRNRVIDRYQNKESLLTIISHLEKQLTIGILN